MTNVVRAGKGEEISSGELNIQETITSFTAIVSSELTTTKKSQAAD